MDAFFAIAAKGAAGADSKLSSISISLHFKKIPNNAHGMGRRSESRELETTTEVLEALGGEHAVAALTQQRGTDGWKNVEGWKRAPTFPSRYFCVMDWALRKKRLRAHPKLWGQVIAPEMEEAAA